MAADSTVGVDSAADTLVLSGPISGNSALTKAGGGTLQLSSTASSFTGGLGVLAGTLQLSSVNAAGSNGPLVQVSCPSHWAQAAIRRRSGIPAPAARPTAASRWRPTPREQFEVDSQAANLTLSGAIGGNGNLNKTGNGTLTLAGPDNYTGTTTVSSGTLIVSGSRGSLASTNISVAGNLTIYNASGASNGNRIPGNATVNLTGGTFCFNNDGSSGNNFSETIGQLNLAGNSTICTQPSRFGQHFDACFRRPFPLSRCFCQLHGRGPGCQHPQCLSITGQPTGFIGGWATSGNDWVKYDLPDSTSVYSVMALSGE